MRIFRHRALGLLFWTAAVVSGLLFVAPREKNAGSINETARSVAKAFWDRPRQLQLITQKPDLRAGDPVFFDESGQGDWVQAGYVQRVEARKRRTDPLEESPAGSAHGVQTEALAIVFWHHDGVNPDRLVFETHRTTGSLGEVARTLLPQGKREQIREQVDVLLREHGREMGRALTPLIRETLLRSTALIEDALRNSMENHREEIEQLANRLEDEVLRERLLPLARKEIVPIVRRHGEPLAQDIGIELWNRASLWRFGWRAVYDRTPLPERRLVREEWERFVEEEAVPVFEDRLDEIVIAVQRTLIDVASNPKVRFELTNVGDELSRDPEVRSLIRTIIRETVVDNPQLRDSWREIWSSAEANRALRIAGDRVEPIVRQIGDEVLGTPETGIDPNFARVLRNQILGKDRRWVVASLDEEAGASRGGVEFDSEVGRQTEWLAKPSKERMVFPLVYLAEPGRVP